MWSKNRLYTWRKSDEVDNPPRVCAPSKNKLSVSIGRCIYYEHDEGFGTLTSVNDITNSKKYIEILQNNLRSFIFRLFPHGNYLSQDDTVLVLRSRLLSKDKEENDINTTAWPAQSLDISFMEILWLKLEKHFLSTKNFIDSRNWLMSKIARVRKNLPVNFICQSNSTIQHGYKKSLKWRTISQNIKVRQQLLTSVEQFLLRCWCKQNYAILTSVTNTYVQWL